MTSTSTTTVPTTNHGSSPSPSPNLNVIALVSGGKDSLYSILHCIRNGHTVVALANLHPSKATATTTTTTSSLTQDKHADAQANKDEDDEEEEEEDIDSFMYQTIGHSVVPLYQEALGIPLYRAAITGGAVDTARVYQHQSSDKDQHGQQGQQGQEDSDETESLVPLLRHIKHLHPTANAVSAGAILSTYQRTRIENVAARLGLASLAWLWMYPVLPAAVGGASPVVVAASAGGDRDAGLLDDMAACGCEARIIKVASGGLDEWVLWGDVSGSGSGKGLRGRLVKTMGRFAAKADIRGAVLGEGGEYESLALDGPGFLWKGRIEVVEREVRRGEGGVGFLRLRGAKCVKKEGDDWEDGIVPGDVPRPGLLDGAFAGLLSMSMSMSLDVDVNDHELIASRSGWKLESTQTNHAGLWTISNLTAPEAGPDTTQQMQAITQKIQTILSTTSRTTDDIVFTTVLLHSMADFTPMNNIYVSLFQNPNPPARATVACGDALPDGVNVMVSLVVDQGPCSARHCLHVQSRSYWAPANIGPYSQAISVPLATTASESTSRWVYVAGQIPLEPASMEIIRESGFLLRAVLALQHLWRIGLAMQVDWWVGGVAYLTASGPASGEHGDMHVRAKVRAAWQVWERMHTKPDSDDDEDAEPVLDAWDLKNGGARGYEQSSASDEIPALPKFDALQQSSSTTIPPFLAVQVAELPRNSDIEWQALGCQCREISLSEQATIDNTLTSVTLEIGLEHSGPGLEAYLQSVLETYNRTECHVALYTAQKEGVCWPGQIVPCKGIWGREARRLIAAVIITRGG